MFIHSILSQRSLRLSLFLFILVSIFCSMTAISTILSFRTLICSSASVILLLIPSKYIVHLCLFFSSSSCLVNISCIFSIFTSILFLRSWIMFTIIILKYFSGRLPVSTSFGCFEGFYLVPSSGTKSSAFLS